VALLRLDGDTASPTFVRLTLSRVARADSEKSPSATARSPVPSAEQSVHRYMAIYRDVCCQRDNGENGAGWTRTKRPTRLRARRSGRAGLASPGCCGDHERPIDDEFSSRKSRSRPFPSGWCPAGGTV
jgi:hypothetical protein